MSKPRKASYVVPHQGGFSMATGWLMRCGSVLHRQLTWDGCSDTAWVVGDPVAGAHIVTGASMGEAVSRYRQLVTLLGPAWPQKLAQARQRTRARVLAMTRRHDVQEWSRYTHYQAPYLGAAHRSR